MAKKVKKYDGRASDLTFSWMLTTLGAEWQQWQELAAEWMAAQTNGLTLNKRLYHAFLNLIFVNAHLTQSICRYFLRVIKGICALAKSWKNLLEQK